MMLTVLQPPSWPRPKGYANAMMGTGTFVLVSGQIGWDAEGIFAEGLVGQTAQALRNVLTILAEAKAGPEHIARVVWYVTDMEAYRASGKAIGAAWREIMGRNFPAMAVIGVSALVEAQACVEIEAVAILPA
ncbi:RidA family protein [Limobrevibacterium gyesilva]|uniref:RidA family protein n=1 Tax=Limobrevibacterium gyesilva TaxID=2991712 RepID=A0AA41YL32_9PROT|nr:RidA family protein [Limobrevibacterium gyesilva]MCW3474371.1 RidA family protein [Limobrevibacterium gyesilva]